eukprot:scaffold432948_cov46-Prasinocladus_malaysianus.AAC.1
MNSASSYSRSVPGRMYTPVAFVVAWRVKALARTSAVASEFERIDSWRLTSLSIYDFQPAGDGFLGEFLLSPGHVLLPLWEVTLRAPLGSITFIPMVPACLLDQTADAQRPCRQHPCRSVLAGKLTTIATAARIVMLGGVTHVTVGLLATFITCACVVAADSGAYLVGKSMGRTKLIEI